MTAILLLNKGATPHHHVLPFLAMHDKQMACRLLNDTIASFRGHGIWEVRFLTEILDDLSTICR